MTGANENIRAFAAAVRSGVISPYVVFYDLETTGTNTKECEITQFAGVQTIFDPTKNRFEKTGRQFVSFIGIVGHVPKVVTQLTGITDEILSSAPGFDEAIEDIRGLIGYGGVGGYNNSRFDDRILTRYFAENGRLFLPSISIDVLPLAKENISVAQVPNYKLSSIYEAVCPGIEKKYHDASEDITATIDVVNAICARIFDTDPADKTTVNPKRISFWQSQWQEKMTRLYVDTDVGKFFYDCYRRSWVTPERGDLSGYDMEGFEKKLLEIGNADSMPALIKAVKAANRMTIWV